MTPESVNNFHTNTNKNNFGIGFDLEGPLVNLEVGHHIAHLKTAKEVGLNLDLENALKQLPHFIGGPDEAVAQDIIDLAQKMNLKINTTAENVFKHKSQLFEKWLKEIKTIPTRVGVFDFLKNINKERIPYTLGSATLKEKVMSYIKRTNLKNYFLKENIITGEDVKRTKPEPDIYLATAKLMNISPSRQIVFEDSPRGVKAGVSAGSLVIAIPVIYNKTTIENLKSAGARKVFREWDEIDLEKIVNLLPKI